MGYFPENTLVAVGPPEALAAAVNHSLVAWSGHYEAAYKIAPEWHGLLDHIEAAAAGGDSSSDGSTRNSNSTEVAQMLAAAILDQLPLRVQHRPGEWPQVGIRVTFPDAHAPQPLPKEHPQAADHTIRSFRIAAEQEGRSAGTAALADWTPLLQRAFGGGTDIEVHPAGASSAVVFAPPWKVHAVLEWLAERPAVRWISPLPRITLKNRQATVIAQSARPAPVVGRGDSFDSGSGGGGDNLDPTVHPVWAAGIQGQNQVIGQGDSGLNYQQCFFNDPAVDWASGVTVVDAKRTFQSTVHRKIRLYRAFKDFLDANGHGTHTAGTLAGIPFDLDIAQGGGVNIGMAPSAKIAFIGERRFFFFFFFHNNSNSPILFFFFLLLQPKYTCRSLFCC
jgi:subtilisin family serine protease